MKTFHSSSQHILLVKATTKAEEIAEKGGIYWILTCTVCSRVQILFEEKRNLTPQCCNTIAFKIGARIFFEYERYQEKFPIFPAYKPATFAYFHHYFYSLCALFWPHIYNSLSSVHSSDVVALAPLLGSIWLGCFWDWFRGIRGLGEVCLHTRHSPTQWCKYWD